MNAKYAYTIDGSAIDVIEAENFNAFAADIDIKGVSIHPGEAKGKLINALLLANELVAMLLADQTPFDSEGKEGYWHLNEINGDSEHATMHFILRDFKDEGIKEKDMNK